MRNEESIDTKQLHQQYTTIFHTNSMQKITIMCSLLSLLYEEDESAPFTCPKSNRDHQFVAALKLKSAEERSEVKGKEKRVFINTR